MSSGLALPSSLPAQGTGARVALSPAPKWEVGEGQGWSGNGGEVGGLGSPGQGQGFSSLSGSPASVNGILFVSLLKESLLIFALSDV